MQIKKHKNKNNYAMIDHRVYVRDFTKKNAPPMDISSLVSDEEYSLFAYNESQNDKLNIPPINMEKLRFEKIVIVSDGYDYKEKQRMLSLFPKDVCIIAVHRALANWRLNRVDYPEQFRRNINMYIVNNPYPSCLTYLPKDSAYYPTCICSSRTNPEFVKGYRGMKYEYYPTPHKDYRSSRKSMDYYVDDYRSPICAAIGLAYQFDCQKLMLFCCDSSISDRRPGMEATSDGLWVYPQQILLHNIVDANLGWLKQTDRKIASHSCGMEFLNAPYISEEEALNFFES